MAIGSFSQAVRLVNAISARAVPDVLPERHIFSGYLYPFISTFFDVDAPDLGPGQQKFKMPGKIASRKTHQLQPKLYDFGTLPTSFEAAGAAATATADTDATVALVAATGLRKYALLKCRRTKAVIQVRSVSTNTVTYRGLVGGAGGGLDAIVVGDKFDFVGYAYPDGATLNTGNTSEPVERSNYLQLHVTETDIGLLAEKRKAYPDGSNGQATDELTNAMQHNEGRERAFLFGEGGLTTVGGELITTMKGLDAWSDIEYDVGGTLSMDEWRHVISPIAFQAGGGGRKKALAGNTVLSVLDALLDAKIQITDQNTSEYKVRLKTLESASGIVDFMGSQPMHEREGEVFIYDPDLMTRMYMEGLDMVHMDDLAPNNVLKSTAAWLTCESLLVHNPDSIVHLSNMMN